MQSIVEAVRILQGRGKEELKKIEGTQFGFHTKGLIDYLFIYLDTVFVSFFLN
jgi:hypothetical protein